MSISVFEDWNMVSQLEIRKTLKMPKWCIYVLKFLFSLCSMFSVVISVFIRNWFVRLKKAVTYWSHTRGRCLCLTDWRHQGEKQVEEEKKKVAMIRRYENTRGNIRRHQWRQRNVKPSFISTTITCRSQTCLL